MLLGAGSNISERLLCLLLGLGAVPFSHSFPVLSPHHHHHQGVAMLPTARTALTRAPAAALAGLRLGRRRACGTGIERRHRPPAPRSTARGSMSTESAAGSEERQRVQGMVSSLSPSSIAAFKQCPQLFYYRYILRLRSPPTLESLKGIAVHEVLSLFFEQEEGSRDLDRLHELFREVMTRLIAQDKEDPSWGYSGLFESQAKEKQWVVECLDLLANFVRVESEMRAAEGGTTLGDPEHVELRMRHTFGEDGQDGGVDPGAEDTNAAAAAATTTTHFDAGVVIDPSDEDTAGTAMSLTGIVDRLDRCSDGTLRVVDYKTGKVPDLKYPEATNKRIMDDKFFQLQIYALLVERVLREVPGEMRLMYLKGSTCVSRKVDPAALPSVESELRSIWDDISASVRSDSFPPRTSRLCGWCSFKDRCPAFEAGE